ncbi:MULTISPECIES: YybH family protein [Micrococcaceae]|uniref:YybH family protein n=1 Tax=Micrococcaceae TaxID=1268 RepID=UPI000410992A|nr:MULTISPECIES: nuclear transport factor 2 family protein [Micrococcaceae]
MDDLNAFLAAVMPRLTEAETALHNGDAEPRKAMWSGNDPVTLFGAVMTKIGRDRVAPAFDHLASQFSDCTSFDYEVIAAGASGDLGYLVGIEHTTASIGGAEPLPYALRVTTVFRREDGEWKVIHRHGDALPDGDSDATRLQLSRFEELDSSPDDAK